jgi:hypothetical protein
MTDYSDHPITKMTEAFLKEHAQSGGSLHISDELFIALKCPTGGTAPPSDNIVCDDSRPDSDGAIEHNLLVIFSAIAGLLVKERETIDLGQLLCAMERAQCWRAIIGTEDQAYLLAAGLISYVEDYVESYEMDDLTAPHICGILNAWLKPDVSWDRLPPIGVICEYMFGTVWPSLALSDDQWEPAGYTYDFVGAATESMLKERPPFLPGLCLAREVASSVCLPDDVGMGA